MADTTSYTSEQLALAIDAVHKKVHRSVLRCNAWVDIYSMHHKKLGLDYPWRMPKSGQVVPTVSGGYNFTIPVQLEEAGELKGLDTKLQTIDPETADVDLRATYPVKTVYNAIAIADMDVNCISGKEAVIEYMVEKSSQALLTHVNGLGKTEMWATTTQHFTPLPLIVNKAGTGTVGGLDPAVHTLWKAQTATSANYQTANAGVGDLSVLLSKMNGVGGKVNVHVTSSVGWGEYIKTQKGGLAIPKVTSDSGYGEYAVVAGAPVIPDENTYTAAGIASWYCIDLDTMWWQVVPYVDEGGKPAFALPLKEYRLPNQFGKVAAIVTMGNFVCSCRNKNGVHEITAS